MTFEIKMLARLQLLARYLCVSQTTAVNTLLVCRFLRKQALSHVVILIAQTLVHASAALGLMS
jgi:hypothetical protein